MKVLLLNGSPRPKGNTALALAEIADTLKKEGIESQTLWIGVKAVQGCVACNKCAELDRCVFQDDLYNSVRDALKTADALIVGSPTYYAGPNGSLCALLDRIFYSCGELLWHKPASAIAVCRRGGASATLDRLNKYFPISHMPIVPSQYWNLAYGLLPGEVARDEEGMQTFRTLARNMAWMLKGLQPIPKPEDVEEGVMTNFIR